MPNMDGTGPHGKGPMSGRGRGRCRRSGQSTVKERVLKTAEETKSVEEKEKNDNPMKDKNLSENGFGMGRRARHRHRHRGE